MTGWAVIDPNGTSRSIVAAGHVRTKGPGMHERLAEIRGALAAVIAEHGPDVLAVETPFLGRNPKTALAIGMARGAVLCAAGSSGLEFAEYAPATVKKSVVGRGSASKEQVAAMVVAILGLAEAPRPEDVTDALAVALAHAHRHPG